MENPTIGQIALGFGVICAVSAGLCLLIWLASRSLKRHGLIVPRQEPPREWVEFANARDELGRVIAKELRLVAHGLLPSCFRRPGREPRATGGNDESGAAAPGGDPKRDGTV